MVVGMMDYSSRSAVHNLVSIRRVLKVEIGFKDLKRSWKSAIIIIGKKAAFFLMNAQIKRKEKKAKIFSPRQDSNLQPSD